jgi:hypothetical protein
MLANAQQRITIGLTVAVGAAGFAWSALRYVHWLASDPKPKRLRYQGRPW